jgi:hypothetical protein
MPLTTLITGAHRVTVRQHWPTQVVLAIAHHNVPHIASRHFQRALPHPSVHVRQQVCRKLQLTTQQLQHY